MNRGSYAPAARACYAGIAVRAVVANVTAALFAPLMGAYGYTYAQLGLLTALAFGAQAAADVLLLFLLGRVPEKALAVPACAACCAGLLLYASAPLLCGAGALFAAIAAATAVFAFAGGMLEVVLSGVAARLPARRGGLFLLHTAYAWSQAAACALLLLCPLAGAPWNAPLFLLALAPAAAALCIARCKLPPQDGPALPAAEPAPAVCTAAPAARGRRAGVYLLAAAAVFFGYGAEVVMNQWVGVYAAEIFTFASGSAAGCALFALCLGAGGALYVALLRRRALPLWLLSAAAVCAAACYALAALAPPPFCLAFAAGSGVFAGLLTPGAMTCACELLPQARGRLIASLAVVQDAGAALLPALAGAAASAASLRAALLLSAAVPASAALFLFCLHRRARTA